MSQQRRGSRHLVPGPKSSLASCVETYGPDTLKNRDFAFDGTVRSIERHWVTFDVNRWYQGGTGDEVAVWMEWGWLGPQTIAHGARLLVSGEPRWGGEPPDDALAWMGCGFTRLYTPEDAEQWADIFSR